mmetsp:Transcript_8689/g.22929  ORF Transcript_8689/g.22929 Transcript_8689/m.22929 type:complete len:461 (+) Transcript_8689:149-1531(+)
MLNVDGDGLESIWSVAAASKDLLKFGGGFYVGKLASSATAAKASTSVVPSASDILAELPRSIYGGIDTLALPTEFDESEKMLLFPESVIKAAVDTLKEVAIDDFKAEQYERAVKHLTVALSLDEKSHVLYSNRCTAFIALEDYDKAMEDADECVRLQPSWAKGYLRRGSVYFRMGQLEQAELVLKEGLDLDPGNDALKKELEAVMNAIAERMARQRESLEAKERAIEAFNEQNYRGAVDLLKKAIKLDPDNHIFYSNRAAAYMAMEKFDKALKDANECVRLQPTWAKGYSRQAAAFLSLGELPQARESCMKGLDLEPDNTQVKEELRRVEIAESLALKDSATEAFKAQDYEKAVEDLTAAIALDPTNQVFYSNRSVAFTAMQMYEKALEDADECIRLQPTWAKGYSRRAAAKFHLGDLQSAKLAYSKAWDLEPNNAKTKADLEHVLSEIAGMKVVLPDRA